MIKHIKNELAKEKHCICVYIEHNEYLRYFPAYRVTAFNRQDTGSLTTKYIHETELKQWLMNEVEDFYIFAWEVDKNREYYYKTHFQFNNNDDLLKFKLTWL